MNKITNISDYQYLFYIKTIYNFCFNILFYYSQTVFFNNYIIKLFIYTVNKIFLSTPNRNMPLYIGGAQNSHTNHIINVIHNI